MLRAKINGKVRVVSKAMARVLRVRGVPVEDTTKAKPVTPAPAPAATVHVREEQTPPLPATPWPTKPKSISFDTLTDSVQMPGVADAGMAVRLGHAADADLTDEELERLTAPDSQSGGEG